GGGPVGCRAVDRSPGRRCATSPGRLPYHAGRRRDVGTIRRARHGRTVAAQDRERWSGPRDGGTAGSFDRSDISGARPARPRGDRSISCTTERRFAAGGLVAPSGRSRRHTTESVYVVDAV